MNFNPECNYNPSTERWNAFVETTLLQPMPEIIGFAFYSVRGRLLSRFGLLSQLNNQASRVQCIIRH
jgi:hypothetical protein